MHLKICTTHSQLKYAACTWEGTCVHYLVSSSSFCVTVWTLFSECHVYIPLPPKRQTPSKRFFLNNLIQSGRNNISGQTILSAGNRHCIKQTREFQDLGEYVVELSRRIVGRDIYVVLPVGGRDGGTLLTLSKDESVHPTTQKRNGQGDAAPPHFFIRMLS